jgi:RNA polymerase sigma-70 factor (ECF subfamily)
MLDLPPRMRRAVDALPRSFREVLLLVDVGEHSYRDVADSLGIPIGTVMSRLHRARRQLAAALGEEARMAA